MMRRHPDALGPEIYELRLSARQYRQRIDDARRDIAAVLKHMRRPYVSYSCGKDSSVLAHLVRGIEPSIPLRFLSSGETRLVHNVDDVLGWFRTRGAVIEEILIDRVFTEEWRDATWDKQRRAGRGDLQGLTDGAWGGVFMGLRMEESKRRRTTLSIHQTPGLPPHCYRYNERSRLAGIIRACPLARWTMIDVGAYLLEHEIPHLRWYDTFGYEGRTTARITGDAVRQNVLPWLKWHDPDSFNRLLKRFPELGVYV